MPVRNDTALVDVILVVHDPDHFVGRAVSSILSGAGGLARVTLVCHGVGVRTIQDALADYSRLPESGAYTYAADDHRVRFLSLLGDARTPAAGIAFGLANAHAPYVALVGPHDELEPGAVRRWLRAGEERGSDVLLAPLRRPDGGRVRDPLSRPGTGRLGPYWKRPLDPVLDRWGPRPPYGLLRREAITQLGLRMDEDAPTDWDLAFRTALRFAPVRADYVPSLPAQVVGSSRAVPTSTPHAELEPVRRLLAESWVEDLGPRRALGVTVLRDTILAVVDRHAEDTWTPDDLTALAEAVEAWTTYCPAALAPLSRADRTVLDAALAAQETELVRVALARRSATGPAALLPRRPGDLWDRESPLRRFARLSLVGVA